jgi:pimeloyl-ACP methyl ester carboxylesterase
MASVDFTMAGSREEVEMQLADRIASKRIRGFLMKNVVRDDSGAFRWKINVAALRGNLDKVLDGLSPEKYSGGEEIAGFPVLFIRGEKSSYISDDDALIINQIFPMARISTIPDAGHWLHVEQPQLLIKTLRYFL